jgi:hypothetical protein
MDAASGNDGPMARFAHSGRRALCRWARGWKHQEVESEICLAAWPRYELARDGRALDARACWRPRPGAAG